MMKYFANVIEQVHTSVELTKEKESTVFFV